MLVSERKSILGFFVAWQSLGKGGTSPFACSCFSWTCFELLNLSFQFPSKCRVSHRPLYRTRVTGNRKIISRWNEHEEASKTPTSSRPGSFSQVKGKHKSLTNVLHKPWQEIHRCWWAPSEKRGRGNHNSSLLCGNYFFNLTSLPFTYIFPERSRHSCSEFKAPCQAIGVKP